jgi:hypothetical protein
MLVGLTLIGQGSTPLVAVDWHVRETEQLRTKIDAAVLRYAAELDNKEYSVVGGRTLQALGLLAALPRLPDNQRADYRKKAAAVVKTERDDFWPGRDRNAVEVAGKLHSSASYHLPLVLLLLELHQAGALHIGDTDDPSRDREMRFGILPAKPVRKDVVRLLALLLAANYHPGTEVFDGEPADRKVWGYRSFGCTADSCTSPTGMAAIGLSAAIFGLNVLQYDEDDFKIQFKKDERLSREDIVNRLADVCAHLLLSLAGEPRPTDTSGLDLNIDPLGVESFQVVIATNRTGSPLARIQGRARSPDVVPPAFYSYQTNVHRGAYYSACVAYTLPTAARVVTQLLKHEHNIGKHYVFTGDGSGRKWRLTHGGAKWEVTVVPDGERRWSPLLFRSNGNTLRIDDAIAASLNACVACATVPKGNERTSRGHPATSPEVLIFNVTTERSHLSQFAALYAFAFYKASVATGDGYTIGRWRYWEELAEGLANPQLMKSHVDAAGPTERKPAALSFALLTLTRTFHPIFPRSEK